MSGCVFLTHAPSNPVAGAQYHWTYELAPVAPRFLSFIQGELLPSPAKSFLSGLIGVFPNRLGHGKLLVSR